MYCRCFTAEKAGMKQAEKPEKRKTCAKFAPKEKMAIQKWPEKLEISRFPLGNGLFQWS